MQCVQNSTMHIFPQFLSFQLSFTCFLDYMFADAQKFTEQLTFHFLPCTSQQYKALKLYVLENTVESLLVVEKSPRLEFTDNIYFVKSNT
jgi:hypothetical protein